MPRDYCRLTQPGKVSFNILFTSPTRCVGARLEAIGMKFGGSQ
jgi:hypothetical protein